MLTQQKTNFETWGRNCVYSALTHSVLSMRNYWSVAGAKLRRDCSPFPVVSPGDDSAVVQYGSAVRETSRHPDRPLPAKVGRRLRRATSVLGTRSIFVFAPPSPLYP
eukprot:Hpha_TRINITY_DN8251_c0_g3::TRINITY_DN8251_c0_g3_i1::g.112030::m.112030